VIAKTTQLSDWYVGPLAGRHHKRLTVAPELDRAATEMASIYRC
jgi:hypothetical protein